MPCKDQNFSSTGCVGVCPLSAASLSVPRLARVVRPLGLAALLAIARGCHAEPALCEASKKKGGVCPLGERAERGCLPSLPRRGKFWGDNLGKRKGQRRPEGTDRRPQPEREATRPPDTGRGGPRSARETSRAPRPLGGSAPAQNPIGNDIGSLKGATRQADRRERDAGAPSNEEGRDPPKRSAGRGMGTPEAQVNGIETSGSRWYYLKVSFCNFDRRDT